MRYPFVLFDVGQTLVGPRRSYGAVYAEVLAGVGLELSPPALERAIREVAAELAASIPPGTDRFSRFPGGESEFWRRFVRRSIGLAAGRDIGADLAERALAPLREAFKRPDAWQVYDDVVPTLTALCAQGCRLGVVSNWDSRLPQLLEALGLGAYFAVVGVSQVERVEKPNPLFFTRVLARLGGSPALALHVGNEPELDLAGARAAGLAALLVDRRQELDPDYAAVADLREVPRLAESGLAPLTSRWA